MSKIQISTTLLFSLTCLCLLLWPSVASADSITSSNGDFSITDIASNFTVAAGNSITIEFDGTNLTASPTAHDIMYFISLTVGPVTGDTLDVATLTSGDLGCGPFFFAPGAFCSDLLTFSTSGNNALGAGVNYFTENMSELPGPCCGSNSSSASLPFTITVTSTPMASTPEPSYFLFLLLGFGLLIGLRGSCKRKPLRQG